MRLLPLALLAGVLLLVAAPPAPATSLLPRNAVELIELSRDIVTGEVLAVSDGLDAQGVPYTEITLRVDETLKGSLAGEISFRQFGLLEPRDLPDGRTLLTVSPQGWPRFKSGERVLLFLHEGSPVNGLRTTVGLFQGKFDLRPEGYVNANRNRGLFDGVRFEDGLLTAAERKVVATGAGPVEADAFESLVRRSVRERWIETGRVADANR